MTPLLTLFLAGSMGGQQVNYVAVDVQTREVIVRQWDDVEQLIPVGSLVKPFLALAYGGPFPERTCRGAVDGCWLPSGHGKLRFRDALAQSCNAYFLNLARGVDAETLRVTAVKFGISPPSSDAAEARIGLGTEWKIAPLALTRAYCELAARSGEPRVNEILAGLELAAKSGTARAIGAGRLAKTGTAPCVAAPKDAGDGFAMVLDPAESPRVALLVRVHGVPGAEAAKYANRILKEIRK